MSVTLTIDGREVTVAEGATVFEAARDAGIEIPTLCHDPKLAPVGVCRMCVVEVEGSRVMAASSSITVPTMMFSSSGSPGW